jgi:hypothetical protein
MKAPVFGRGRHGLRVRKQRRASYSAAAAWVSLALACGGDALVVAEELAQAEDVGTGGGEPIIAAGAGGSDAVALVTECPPDPAERQALPGCWPTRHLGHWRGFFIGNASYELADGTVREFPLGDLVLTLELGGSGSLTFGAEAPTPSRTVTADADLCAGTLPAAGCSAAGQIIPGFVYSLEQIEMLDADFEPMSRITGELPLWVGERLYFGIPLGQPWQAGCERQPPRECFCSCFAAGRSLAISLEMSGDGQALRGAYVPLTPNQSPVRVEFLKELAP